MLVLENDTLTKDHLTNKYMENTYLRGGALGTRTSCLERSSSCLLDKSKCDTFTSLFSRVLRVVFPYRNSLGLLVDKFHALCCPPSHILYKEMRVYLYLISSFFYLCNSHGEVLVLMWCKRRRPRFCDVNPKETWRWMLVLWIVSFLSTCLMQEM